MAFLPRSMVLSSLAVMAGCHLIGGVYDLDYSGFGGAGSGTGSAEGGGAMGGGGDGGGCAIADCALPCCDPDRCEPTPSIPSSCPNGICDGAGVCAVGGVDFARMFGSDVQDLASPTVSVSGNDTPTGHLVVTLESGDIVAAGHTTAQATLTFGTGAEYTTGSADNAFIVRLGADLQGKWAKRLTMSADEGGDRSVTALAPAGDGVVVGGDFRTIVELFPKPAGQTASTDDPGDAFVAVLDADGDAQWFWSGASGADMASERITAVAASDGYVAALGYSDGALSFAGKMLDPGTFLLLFDRANGEELVGDSWSCSQTLGPGGNGRDVAFDSSGRLWVTGAYQTSNCVIIGETATFVEPGFYMFTSLLRVVRGNDGSGVTLETDELYDFGGSGKVPCRGERLAATADGGMVVAGVFFPGTLDFGDVEVSHNVNAKRLPFVAKYEPQEMGDPAVVWADSLELDDEVEVKDLAADPAGRVALVINQGFNVTMSDPFSWKTPGDGDAVLLKWAPDGKFLWGLGSKINGDDFLTSATFVDGGALVGFGHGNQDGMYGAPEAAAGDFDVVMVRTNP